MVKKISLKINEQEIVCPEGFSIMRAAHENGIDIPNLCFHPDLSAKANCRVCVVEVSGRKNLATACSTKAEEGMEVRTDTERARRSRNLNIELIFAEHIEKCPTCVWRLSCKLLELAEKYKIEITRFKDRKGKRKVYKFANAVEIDGSQCIDCRNCLDACNKLQKINFLELRGKGINQEITPVTEKEGFAFMKKNRKKIDCIYCGQCALHCPVSAAQEQDDWPAIERILKNSAGGKSSHPLACVGRPVLKGQNDKIFARGANRILAAQIAPSIRVSIGEEFGAARGKITTGQIAAALKKLGFNYVFDVNFGADITTIAEAEELLERLKMKPPLNLPVPGLKTTGAGENRLPMLTSCCPAWVKYVEFYRPDLIPNLTTARSPQIHAAGLIKTYWAEKIKINPGNITVVSIMPCTAKKFEASRKELRINGLAPIDYVLTTRELAWLIKRNKINFTDLKVSAMDNPLAEFSGAAAIYGATGGVMESALRTAAYLLETAQDRVCRDREKNEKSKIKTCASRIDFKDVRGLAGVKKAEVIIADKKIRVAVVNGIGSIKPILDNLKDFDYIEVMACPDGCVGGGGQPIPTTAAIRKKRLEALYKIDQASEIRRAHENQGAIQALAWLKEKGKLEKEVLYTKYQKRS